jgi:hypothetical protein
LKKDTGMVGRYLSHDNPELSWERKIELRASPMAFGEGGAPTLVPW